MMVDELLNAQDLITAKKHDTFHSEVVTGKAGGLSTGANIDYATNAVTGQVQKTLPKVIDDLDWSYVGLFADGVTFTKKTDFAVDAVGTQWIYIGSLPFTAAAGTVPSEPTYQAVHAKSADAISNANGGSVQDFIDKSNAAKDRNPDSLDNGAVANGVTNDSVANQSVADLNVQLSESVIGVFTGGTQGDVSETALLHNRTTGRVVNPKVTQKLPCFGIEFLQHWFAKFVGDNQTVAGTTTQKVIVITGDSTTFGVGATYATPEAIFTEAALNNGYMNVGVVNRGQSGSTAQQWDTSYINGDLALNPDLLVMRWGANDPFFKDTSTDTLRKQGVVETLGYIRSAVSKARAARNVSQMSMVLCTPGPMNDVEKGRDEVYFERLNAGLRQIALDYQCAFVDTYAMVQAAHGAAGIWMDASDSDGDSGTSPRAIHPNDVMYEHQVAAVAEYVMPKHGIGWKVNDFRNSSLGRVVRKGLDPATSYKAGIDLDRMDQAVDTTPPYNGVSLNFRQADGGILQVNYPMNGQAQTGYTKGAMAVRNRFNGLTSSWFGVAQDITSLLQNGWVTLSGGYGALKMHLSIDGLVTLTGTLSSGTATNGTILCTLPAGYRPKATEIIPCHTNSQICEIRVKTTGVVELWNLGTPTYLIINGSFVVGN